MSKCLVSVVLIKRILKVQGRDIGYSLAYDYDNKIFQRMTAIFTQYTVRMNDNVQCDVSIQTMTFNVVNLRRQRSTSHV